MLTKKRKRIRTPSKERIAAVSEAFKEIEGYFEFMAFPASEKESDWERPAEEESEDDYEDEESGGVQTFEREDIEVAIDVFITELKPDAHPSLENIFVSIFGDDHEIIKLIQQFEEDIEGYFDVIGYDDMKSAYGQVLEIRAILDREMARHAEN